MKQLTFSVLALSLFSMLDISFAQKLQLNDLGYFETRGLNVLVFSNEYNGYFFDEKHAGIELIQCGVRTATNGAVRLRSTPEQWDAVPAVVDRMVDRKKKSIEVTLGYKEYDFYPKVVVTAENQEVWIAVYLDKPLPERLIGHAGFNLEFLPTEYSHEIYLMDHSPHIFPLYPAGPIVTKPDSLKISQYANHSTFDGKGRQVYVDPLPMATGSTLILAPADSQRRVEIRSTQGKLMFYDGRNIAENGWLVVRSLIPENKTGNVVEWHLIASSPKNWIRKPVIEFSQVGYHPKQEKRAVIELDKNDAPLKTASLYRVTPQGNFERVFTAPVETWGTWMRYNDVTFDFSSVQDSGVYFIKYGNEKSNVFPIASHVYNNVWHQTLDVWFPVQMDHMYVRDAYRVWHGVPFLDDARQAPPNEEHFDGYSMGKSTGTRYKPGEHIPGLNVGGWFDAGDFDIDEPSQCRTISNFAAAWEAFKPQLDETYISERERYVDIHDPDGKPDILQQIEHGILQQLGQQKAFGRAIAGINEAHLYEYVQVGDAADITDNKIYTPRLKPYQVEGDSSGTPDDRWAFTSNEPWINDLSIGALASASRALKGFNDSLSAECLAVAEQSWDRQHKDTIVNNSRVPFFAQQFPKIAAALQLYISSKNIHYADTFTTLIWQALDRFPDMNIQTAVLAIPYFGKEYKDRLKPYVETFKKKNDELLKNNPYGVPIGTRQWGGSQEVVGWAVTNYYLHEAFPNIIGSEYAIRGIAYLFGCHPYSNISFVSGVGVHSKESFYGGNRADLSFIAGGVVPGILILKPDFPENQEDWPFLWGENESVINICSEYIFLANAVKHLLKEEVN
ncbi:MAG: glycoside hydrolase family 9 protein [Bacteroidota bacterium]|nr:glycoside hydrolase family 9 protein [Bacteroidota bacterium]